MASDNRHDNHNHIPVLTPLDYASASPDELIFNQVTAAGNNYYHLPTTTSAQQPAGWAVSLDQAFTSASVSAPVSDTASPTHSGSPAYTVSSADWTSIPTQTQSQQQRQVFPLLDTQFAGVFTQPFQSSPIDLLPHTTAQGSLDVSLPMDTSFMGLPAAVDPQWAQWQEFALLNSLQDGMNMAALSQSSVPEHSPASTYIELRSVGSDGGWVDVRRRVDTTPFTAAESSFDSTIAVTSTPFDPTFAAPVFDGFPTDVTGAIFNPGETLHLRTDSCNSDSTGFSWTVSDGCTDLYHHDHQHAITSPESDGVSPPSIMPVTAVAVASREGSASSPASRTVSNSSGSPPSSSVTRKSPSTKNSKPVIRRRSDPTKKDTEKRVGRRRGPLLPEQRKQASEIRKLRACLRCKFLKKTCDKGEPCAGCQPSHARLWQVPCTRIDIKDINYFMKDFKADFERHVTLDFSVNNIKGFAATERNLYITHGYGFVMNLSAREVYVHNEDCFTLDWLEDDHDGSLERYNIATAGLTAGAEGVSHALLHEYLDRHVDGRYNQWVDEFFDGTPFLSELLKTAHRYYTREKTPVIRKALKLVLAYNLTTHITLVEGLTPEEELDGRCDDERSKYFGKTFAPVMINFQVKCALAEVWRELQKEVLEELSSLYSGVYNGDKLKNWPTIFLLAAILLGVWEEMQFDCHYRIPDGGYVDKFCNDMETTPVGVIVGLFHAISQKLPTFAEWDSSKHHHLLNSNAPICDAMTEMRQHINKYDTYLRSRSESKFDSNDFDCLSNKFVSKLVIRV